MRQTPRMKAEYYGNLVRVAIRFYLTTNNPAELKAVAVYARLAFTFARKTLDSEQ